MLYAGTLGVFGEVGLAFWAACSTQTSVDRRKTSCESHSRAWHTCTKVRIEGSRDKWGLSVIPVSSSGVSDSAGECSGLSALRLLSELRMELEDVHAPLTQW